MLFCWNWQQSSTRCLSSNKKNTRVRLNNARLFFYTIPVMMMHSIGLDIDPGVGLMKYQPRPPAEDNYTMVEMLKRKTRRDAVISTAMVKHLIQGIANPNAVFHDRTPLTHQALFIPEIMVPMMAQINQSVTAMQTAIPIQLGMIYSHQESFRVSDVRAKCFRTKIWAALLQYAREDLKLGHTPLLFVNDVLTTTRVNEIALANSTGKLCSGGRVDSMCVDCKPWNQQSDLTLIATLSSGNIPYGILLNVDFSLTDFASTTTPSSLLFSFVPPNMLINPNKNFKRNYLDPLT